MLLMASKRVESPSMIHAYVFTVFLCMLIHFSYENLMYGNITKFSFIFFNFNLGLSESKLLVVVGVDSEQLTQDL